MDWYEEIGKVMMRNENVQVDDERDVEILVYMMRNSGALFVNLILNNVIPLVNHTARLAIQAGAAGIIVSNHGARQLDYVPATIMALEEVVKAAQGRVPVFLDGGVRRGTDVFKALALGASGIFIGRPVVFSLAAEGEAGVKKVLQMLRDEFELTMALSGCTSLKEITRDHIVTEWDAPRTRPAPRL